MLAELTGQLKEPLLALGACHTSVAAASTRQQ